MVIDFTIPGEPKGKGRPRFGKGHAYTPDVTENYESYIKLCCARAARTPFPPSSRIKMEIHAYYGIPSSAPKYKRIAMANGDILPTKKPDIDNVAKIVCDALNGLAYKDDKQIVEMYVRKRYSGNPRVEVFMEDV